MIYLFYYYLIGVIVSLYFIYYYRISERTKSQPSKNDGWLGITGPWLFPIQIILHFFTRNNHKQK